MNDVQIRLLKTLVRSLDSLKASLDKQVEAISKQTETSKKHERQDLPVQIRSELRLPKAIRGYYEADQRERQSKWAKLKTGLEYIGVTAAVVLAVLTYLTFRRISSQAESAREQVGLMRQQLETTDRAWVKIARAEPLQDVEFKDSGKKVDVLIGVGLSAENIGRSVALNARVTARVLLSQNLIAEELEQVTACNGDNLDSGVQLITEEIGPFSIFPSETRQFRVFWNGTIDAKFRGRDMDPSIVGCVTYFLPNSQTPHKSGFAYALQYRPADPIQPWNKRPIRVGQNANKADLIAWPVAGFDSLFGAN